MTDRGRRNLIIWLVILAIPLLLIAAIWISLSAMFGDYGKQRALDGLARVDLFAQLGTTPSAIDHIIFEDGGDGWFAIVPPERAANKTIGFFGTRILDVLSGGQHIPNYCGGPGKIVWGIRDNAILTSLAFCFERRMELSELRPVALPVSIIEETRNRAEVTALLASVAADPNLLGITIPSAFKPFDHTVTITTPYTWTRWDTPVSPRLDWTQIIATQLDQQFPQLAGQYTFDLVNDSAPELTTFTPNDAGDGFDKGQTGPTIQNGGQTFLLTEVNWIERGVLRLNCAQATCTALRSLDLTRSFDAYRDFDLLDKALADPVLMPDRNPETKMPTASQLRDPKTLTTDVQEVTYVTKHATLRP